MSKKLPSRTPSKQIQIEVDYVTLPQGENDERIQRLTRKILRALQFLEDLGEGTRANPDQGPAESQESLDSLLSVNFEKRLGI